MKVATLGIVFGILAALFIGSVKARDLGCAGCVHVQPTGI